MKVGVDDLFAHRQWSFSKLRQALFLLMVSRWPAAVGAIRVAEELRKKHKMNTRLLDTHPLLLL